MAWTDGKKEQDRLGAMYREMSDGELLGLEATAGDLTEVAQEALAGEMNRRGLESSAAKDEAVPGAGSFGKNGDSGWKTLHVFSQTFEAQAAFRLLEREEIEFAVEDRTIDEEGEVRPGPAVQLALIVDAGDWDRAVALLRREAGLFPEAVEDPRGEEESADGETVTVGEFEDAGDVLAASRVLEEARVWFRTVKHDGEEWERTAIEVRAEDGDRALETLERLLEEDASRL